MPSVWDIQFTYTILALYKYDCSTVKGSLAMNNSFTYRSCCPDDGKWEEGKGLQIFFSKYFDLFEHHKQGRILVEMLGEVERKFLGGALVC